jgi:hypothetical protein
MVKGREFVRQRKKGHSSILCLKYLKKNFSFMRPPGRDLTATSSYSLSARNVAVAALAVAATGPEERGDSTGCGPDDGHQISISAARRSVGSADWRNKKKLKNMNLTKFKTKNL